MTNAGRPPCRRARNRITPTTHIGTAPQVTIGIKGENLANEDVLDHTSFKRREDVLQPGASVRAFGIVKLN
jgi:hypothetical protein